MLHIFHVYSISLNVISTHALMRVNMHCLDHNGKQAPGPGNKGPPPPLSSATLLNSSHREKGKSVSVAIFFKTI